MARYGILSSGRPIRHGHGAGKVRTFSSLDAARKVAKRHPGRKVVRIPKGGL